MGVGVAVGSEVNVEAGVEGVGIGETEVAVGELEGSSEE